MEKPVALVVEDDPDLSTVFSEAVRAAGFEAETLSTGDEALKRLAGPMPWLMLLDLHLPGVTGEDILKYVETQPRLEKMHVIVASADDRLAQNLFGKATLVLLKPISFVQLRDLAERFMPAAT